MKTLANGMSMMELIISLTIVALVIAIGLPMGTYYYHQTNAETTIMKIQNNLQLARNEAIKRHTVVTLCHSADQVRCGGSWNDTLIIFADNNRNHQLDKNEPVIQVIQAPRGGQLQWRGFGGQDYIEFTPYGLDTQQNGTLVYCSGSRQIVQARGIIISKTGRTRLATVTKKGRILDATGQEVQC
jgi:type IV fimbrial biogenesis protein FimT